MIEVEGLFKRYGSHLVADDLNFTIEKGKIDHDEHYDRVPGGSRRQSANRACSRVFCFEQMEGKHC